MRTRKNFWLLPLAITLSAAPLMGCDDDDDDDGITVRGNVDEDEGEGQVDVDVDETIHLDGGLVE